MLLRPVLTNGRSMPVSGSIPTPAAEIQTASTVSSAVRLKASSLPSSSRRARAMAKPRQVSPANRSSSDRPVHIPIVVAMPGKTVSRAASGSSARRCAVPTPIPNGPPLATPHSIRARWSPLGKVVSHGSRHICTRWAKMLDPWLTM